MTANDLDMLAQMPFDAAVGHPLDGATANRKADGQSPKVSFAEAFRKLMAEPYIAIRLIGAGVPWFVTDHYYGDTVSSPYGAACHRPF